VWVHYCGFRSLTVNNTLDCACGQLQGISVADNFVPWGETLCLAPPDTVQWTESMETCPQVRCALALAPTRITRRGRITAADWALACLYLLPPTAVSAVARACGLLQDCTESGCNNFDCGYHNLTVGYIESNRFALDVPVFDTTNPEATVVFTYNRPYVNKLVRPINLRFLSLTSGQRLRSTWASQSAALGTSEHVESARHSTRHS
jgi:hypothetical protein